MSFFQLAIFPRKDVGLIPSHELDQVVRLEELLRSACSLAGPSSDLVRDPRNFPTATNPKAGLVTLQENGENWNALNSLLLWLYTIRW